ncbi:MAG: hypothetical protein ABL915_01615 [Gallionella sp.]
MLSIYRLTFAHNSPPVRSTRTITQAAFSDFSLSIQWWSRGFVAAQKHHGKSNTQIKTNTAR